MKRFQFTLEKAKRYREALLLAEEARYSNLLSAEASIACRMDQLSLANLDQKFAMSRSLQADGSQFERLHQFGEFVSVEVNRLGRERDALRKEVSLQAAKVAGCRQQVELLDKLKDKELERWTRQSDRELQLAAEESFNASWLRDARRGP